MQDVTITQTGLATSVFNPPFGTSYSPTITAIGTTTTGSVITASVNVHRPVFDHYRAGSDSAGVGRSSS